MPYTTDVPLETPREDAVQFPTGEWLSDEPPMETELHLRQVERALMVQVPQACKLVMTLLTTAP